MGCSYANAGRFCPSRLLGFPPAKPEKVVSTFKALAKSRPTPSKEGDEVETPSSVSLTLRLICYGIHFLRNCTPGAFERNNLCFKDLAERSLAATERLLQAARISAAEIARADGNVWLYGSAAQAEADGGSKAAVAAACGWPALEPMGCGECGRRFPELATWIAQGGAKGGCLVAPSDWSADARAFASALRRAAERSGRVAFEWGARVERLARPDELGGAAAGVALVDGAGGARVLTADAVVVCCGLATRQLLAAAAPRFALLPLVGMRGYSVDLEGAPAPPRMSVSDFSTELNLQATPLGGGRVRLVGYAEFCEDAAPDAAHRAARKETMLRRARAMLPGLGGATPGELWTGLRPMTPDFLPLVGRLHALPGVYVNAGHGGVGWTLCAATAELLADDVICGGGSAACAPYAPDRFLLWNFDLFDYRDWLHGRV